MASTVFILSLFRLYRNDINDDIDRLIVICHWILLKNKCVINNEPEKEIITWNMARDKTMVVDYCYDEDIQFVATFGPFNDSYVVKFTRGDDKLMIPLNIYTHVVNDLSKHVPSFESSFKRGFNSFISACKLTDTKKVNEQEKDIN